MWKCPECGRTFKKEHQSHYCGKAPETVEHFAEQRAAAGAVPHGKRFAAIRILAAALLAAAMCMTGLSCGMPDTGKDEIRLRIRLDLKEDIGLFLIDSEVNGQNTSGGSSNADRSMLKRDETLYWSIDRRHYENVPDAVSLTLRFRIVTEYFDPNYENIYPEEYVMPMEEIAFTAVFGGTYDFIVTGDRVNGYRAVLK